MSKWLYLGRWEEWRERQAGTGVRSQSRKGNRGVGRRKADKSQGARGRQGHGAEKAKDPKAR